MMYSKISGKSRLGVLLAIDTLVLLGCYVGAYVLRFDFRLPGEYHQHFLKWLPWFLIIKIFLFYMFGLYRGIWRYTSLWDLLNILKATTIASVILVILMSFTSGLNGFPRSIFVLDFILTAVMIALVRISVRLYYTHLKFDFNTRPLKSSKRLLLIGAGKTGEKIIREIINDHSSIYTVIGFVDDDPRKKGATLHGCRVLGSVEDIVNIKIPYEELLITAPSATGSEMRRIVEHCKNTGKRYKTVPSLPEIIDNDISISNIREVSYLDILGRAEVKLDMNSMDELLKGKRVLVTGAGGSIGSELVRQCLNFSPGMIILLDNSEYNLFSIEQEINYVKPRTVIRSILGDIRDKSWLQSFFHDYNPQIILHAAAYKHVPIQEKHPREAVLTNVVGTLNLVETSLKIKPEKFVLVSTDKAVHPVNIMGATKRLAEMMIQNLDKTSVTQFMAVRFGNVIGSSGSVAPIFQEQIRRGGPVRITHPDMIRYFMSITEAAQLILQAAALGSGGEIFVLDMGRPVRIKDMAYDLIRLSGLEPEKDIPIVYTGVREGEKLFEELVIKGENVARTGHSKIMVLRNGNRSHSWKDLVRDIEKLYVVSQSSDSDSIKGVLQAIVPEYEPRIFVPRKSTPNLDMDSTSYEA